MDLSQAVKLSIERTGGRALSLFASPLNALILRALSREPMNLPELRKATGGTAQTTLRSKLATLIELGAIAQRRRPESATQKVNHLTELGMELELVAGVLEQWLEDAPDGPVPLGSDAGKAAIKALTAAWEATMLCAFAARPFTLTQLNEAIGGIDYPTLERRLSAMRATGLVAPISGGGTTAYTITPWARRGVGAIVMSVRFERLCMESDSAPLIPMDIEGIFLLGLPMTTLSPRVEGTCHLSAETGGDDRALAGVHLTIDRGRILSLVSRTDPSPLNWAHGSATAWLDVLVSRNTDGLAIGGDADLVRTVVHALHDSLIGAGGG